MSLVYTADSIVICVSCILVHVDVRLTHSGGCFHTVYLMLANIGWILGLLGVLHGVYGTGSFL